ncbi:MAG: hypothetical protein NTW15_04180 [Burkholderiales bacterium]|nr:hypothetical protein [Burkholderiales bacterium]
MILIAGSVAMSGCAFAVLEATPITQTECRPLNSTVSRQSYSFSPLLAASDATFLESLETVTIPFRNPPPVAGTRGDMTALGLANRQAPPTAFTRSVSSRYSSDVMTVAQSPLPPEVEDAGRELWAALYELSPSAKAAENFRAALFDRSAGSATSTAEVLNLNSSAQLSRRISKAIQSGGEDGLLASTFADLNAKYSGFSALSAQGNAETRRTAGIALNEAQANFEAAVFVQVYVKRYFRNGKILQSKVAVDDLASRALASLGNSIPNTEKEAALAKLRAAFEKACTDYGDGGCTLTSLGKDSFVTRSGEVIQFKGVSLTVGSGGRFQPAFEYPKSSDVAPQLTRVVVEALFDSVRGRPAAIAASTACVEKLMVGDECLTDDVLKKRPGLEKSVGDLDAKASRADHLATVATSQLIRGASIAALNNEALARSAENLAGVVARKFVERAVWQQQGEDVCPSVAPAAILNATRR